MCACWVVVAYGDVFTQAVLLILRFAYVFQNLGYEFVVNVVAFSKHAAYCSLYRWNYTTVLSYLKEP